MGRREMREHIFKLLFLREFNEAEEMPEQIKLYFDEMEDLGPDQQTYMENKYDRIQEHLEEIDRILNEKSTGWKTKRMSKVDLNILRLAVFEMKYDEDVPVKVAINEAVEISKVFGGEDSAAAGGNADSPDRLPGADDAVRIFPVRGGGVSAGEEPGLPLQGVGGSVADAGRSPRVCDGRIAPDRVARTGRKGAVDSVQSRENSAGCPTPDRLGRRGSEEFYGSAFRGRETFFRCLRGDGPPAALGGDDSAYCAAPCALHQT